MMKNPLELTHAHEYLRASHISRWGIVKTSHAQNIAEHQYRVWTLVRMWGPGALNTPEDLALCERLALLHDLPEIRTGDNPTPIKVPEFKAHLAEVEASIFPELSELLETAPQNVREVLKFCDTSEAILFLKVCGLGEHARSVMGLLRKQMKSRLDGSGLGLGARDHLWLGFTHAEGHT